MSSTDTDIAIERLHGAQVRKKKAEEALKIFIQTLSECDMAHPHREAIKTLTSIAINHEWLWQLDDIRQNCGDPEVVRAMDALGIR